jgi:YidC/Oxa1 family membrane protein insertase
VDKKTIAIIVAISLVIIFYWPILQFLGLAKPEPPAPAKIVTDSVTVGLADSTVKAPAIADQTTPAAPTLGTASPILVDTTAIKPDTIAVQTNKYTVLLSTMGGGPVSIKLKEYSYRNKQAIELLPDAKSATPVAQFAGSTVSTGSIPFTCNLKAGSYDATHSDLRVEFLFQNPKGGAIRQTYIFHPDKYDYDLILALDGRELLGFERQYNIFWPTPLGVTEPDPGNDYTHFEAVAYMSKSREKLGDFTDGRLDQTLTGMADWAALRSQYFAVAIIPSREDTSEGVFAQGTREKTELNGSSFERRDLRVGLEMPMPLSSSVVDSFTIYAGPLDYTMMSDYDVNLEAILDIGTTPFFGWIIKPFALGIIWLLPRMYAAIPNYGFVIILFAILIKLITLPLSLKSYKSMAAMKDLQPKIEELKKKLKNNPQQLNTETMKLYKAHGVNPFSGCLPILPQMPLFFALFAVFRSTILLRDAPFIWFITDLSRGASSLTDPYLILVVLMVVSQFLSSYVTMSSNPQNKMLVYMMPLLMGFIFYRFAAGLVLYWTSFSLLSIVDYYMFRRSKNTEVQLPTPMK